METRLNTISFDAWRGDTPVTITAHPENVNDYRISILFLLDRIARALEDANRLEGNHPSRI